MTTIDDLNDSSDLEAYRKGKRARKYRNVRTVAEGITFDSQAEYRRYCELKMLQDGDQIQRLRVHVPFIVVPKWTDWQGKNHRAIHYIADFVYVENGFVVIEDVKGGKATQTRTWRVKWETLQYRMRGRKVFFKVVEK